MKSGYFSFIASYDWLLFGAVFLLMLLGLVTLFSLSTEAAFPFLQRQLVWVGIGLLCLAAASAVDFRIFRTQGSVVLLFYLATVLLLVFVLLTRSAIRGVESWFKIGGVLVQPVEPAKLALIILLAKFFSKRHIEIYRVSHIVISGAYLALPTVLVLKQPDLGSALVLIGIWVGMVVFSGMRVKHFLFLSLAAVALSVLAWNLGLASYQKDRITAFLNPDADRLGSGYQTIQSMIAVGSGRIWGKGLGYGSQTHLHFLPEAESDFIFAAFAEEWGFIGVIIILGLLGFLLWRIIRIGMLASDNFSRLYAIGFVLFIFIQSFIHIGANMGVLPITGITLPFVSYGGSSLVILLVGIGILQNIHMNARRTMGHAEEVTLAVSRT